MIQLAVFNSHPIQHFAPWWQEAAKNPLLRIKVYYYSHANVQPRFDVDYAMKMSYDVDLLGGYDHAFLPRAWPFRDQTSLAWYALNKGIRGALQERPWDGAFVFGYNTLNNWRVLRACRKKRIPVLYFSDSSIRVGFRRPAWKLAVRGWLIRQFFRRIDAFLSPSASNAEFLKRSGAPVENIWRCPIPVDAERFRSVVAALGSEERSRLRQRHGLNAEDFVVVFCAKLIDRKRPLDLVEAVRATGDPQIKALFIGSGPLESAVRQRGGESVRMAGFVNQQEIPRVMALGDVTALTSSYDLHPLTVVESLVLGVPVVVSDVIALYGPEEIVRDGENGFVYPCGDVRALANLLSRLKADPGLRERLGRRATDLGQTHSPRAATEALLRCLDDLRRRRTLESGQQGGLGFVPSASYAGN